MLKSMLKLNTFVIEFRSENEKGGTAEILHYMINLEIMSEKYYK